jgi:hypothetical protein
MPAAPSPVLVARHQDTREESPAALVAAHLPGGDGRSHAGQDRTTPRGREPLTDPGPLADARVVF